MCIAQAVSALKWSVLWWQYSPVKYDPWRLLSCCFPERNQKISAHENMVFKLQHFQQQKNSGKKKLREVKFLYLIMPPLTVPRTGSCHVLYKSCMSSCLWAWAQTSPAYFVTSGQSWEATTCRQASLYQQPDLNKFEEQVQQMEFGKEILQQLSRGLSPLHSLGESHLLQK